MWNKIEDWIPTLIGFIFVAASGETLFYFNNGLLTIVFCANLIATALVIIGILVVCLLVDYTIERYRHGRKHKRGIFRQILQKLRTFRIKRS